MASTAENIPDYGWRSGQGEAAHRYLFPAVTALIDEMCSGSARGIRVFDAGCGNGAMLRTLAARGFQVAGCDASASGVAIARQNCDGARVERLSVYEPLAETFGNGWDFVIATEVVEHLYAPRDFVARARELLAPDGAVIFTTPYHGYFKNVVLAASGALDSHFTALWDGGHIKFWSYATLKALLAEQGFGEFRFRGAGRVPFLWKSMVIAARLGAARPLGA